MIITVDKMSTILVAIAWLGAVTLNGAYAVAPPPPAENTGHSSAKQLGCRCTGCSAPVEETPKDDREDRPRPLGSPSCPGGCPVCAYASMLTPPTWSPGSHCSTYRRLPADDVIADSGHVRKDIDPPRA